MKIFHQAMTAETVRLDIATFAGAQVLGSAVIPLTDSSSGGKQVTCSVYTRWPSRVLGNMKVFVLKNIDQDRQLGFEPV